jgi:hypothetical protein
MSQLFTVTLLCAAFAVSSVGDEGHHHDQVNEQQLGTVHFPTSCSPTVQRTFESGVALLHSFAFETAEVTFRQVAQDDPSCAMAHWGIAKTFDGERRTPDSLSTVGMKSRLPNRFTRRPGNETISKH